MCPLETERSTRVDRLEKVETVEEKKKRTDGESVLTAENDHGRRLAVDTGSRTMLRELASTYYY
ncbi:hypothetical protein C491_08584 [Natronococcus amylolyticus DSM 10524]|uniref:Uncharacterized protein n=1 Tax=Natronococcus amylolyticus DSM 10524 TaxID=1227497 RepID=L9XCN0_9EURY|nr:hypothetical protein C491_08584 [Natronococcus amylolyticus DSM 10524]